MKVNTCRPSDMWTDIARRARCKERYYCQPLLLYGVCTRVWRKRGLEILTEDGFWAGATAVPALLAYTVLSYTPYNPDTLRKPVPTTSRRPHRAVPPPRMGLGGKGVWLGKAVAVGCGRQKCRDSTKRRGGVGKVVAACGTYPWHHPHLGTWREA